MFRNYFGQFYMNSSNSHWTYFCWNWISPVEKRTQSCELAFIWTTSHFYEDQRYVETNPFTKFPWNYIVGFLDFGRDYYDHPRSVVDFHNRACKIVKVHIFWEGHKILRNLPLTFDCMPDYEILQLTLDDHNNPCQNQGNR